MVKNRLKEIRMREYMMTPGEFAALLEVTPKVYWSWENNNSRPTLEKAINISEILNRDVRDIWYHE